MEMIGSCSSDHGESMLYKKTEMSLSRTQVYLKTMFGDKEQQYPSKQMVNGGCLLRAGGISLCCKPRNWKIQESGSRTLIAIKEWPPNSLHNTFRALFS